MSDSAPTGRVLAVALDGRHRFSKPTRDAITLLRGIGVEGDAHSGPTVQHLSRVRRDPGQPNLRQVHLMHAELFTRMLERGHAIEPGQLGENITTEGVDLLGLPEGARLQLGDQAVVEITGLRNPCTQINGLSDGLMKELIRVDDNGNTIRLAGVMSIVVQGGVVRPGDGIRVSMPPGELQPLGPV